MSLRVPHLVEQSDTNSLGSSNVDVLGEDFLSSGLGAID
jgi:hypothetical protein